jgi:TIR domain
VNERSTSKARLIFVSHSGSDTWVAKQIAREIETRGGTPFLDEAEVDAGADFEEHILNFLEKAHELVACRGENITDVTSGIGVLPLNWFGVS